MLKNEFFQIVQDITNLLSWNRDIGIQSLDVSEDSLKIVNSWGYKQPLPIYSSKRNISSYLNIDKVQQKNYLKDQKPTNKKVEISVDIATDFNPDSNSDTQLNSNLICEGDINSQILFFAESFSYTDAVGGLFIKILKAMNLKSDIVCLCTFPTLDYKVGIPKVREQINEIREKIKHCINNVQFNTNGFSPQIICTLGDSALKILMGREYMLTSSRGNFHNYNGITLMPTYHPSQLIADTSLKKLVWEDMKQIMAIIQNI